MPLHHVDWRNDRWLDLSSAEQESNAKMRVLMAHGRHRTRHLWSSCWCSHVHGTTASADTPYCDSLPPKNKSRAYSQLRIQLLPASQEYHDRSHANAAPAPAPAPATDPHPHPHRKPAALGRDRAARNHLYLTASGDQPDAPWLVVSRPLSYTLTLGYFEKRQRVNLKLRQQDPTRAPRKTAVAMVLMLQRFRHPDLNMVHWNARVGVARICYYRRTSSHGTAHFLSAVVMFRSAAATAATDPVAKNHRIAVAFAIRARHKCGASKAAADGLVGRRHWTRPCANSPATAASITPRRLHGVTEC